MFKLALERSDLSCTEISNINLENYAKSPYLEVVSQVGLAWLQADPTRVVTSNIKLDISLYIKHHIQLFLLICPHILIINK